MRTADSISASADVTARLVQGITDEVISEVRDSCCDQLYAWALARAPTLLP
jgi:hypothetical protein